MVKKVLNMGFSMVGGDRSASYPENKEVRFEKYSYNIFAVFLMGESVLWIA